MLKACKISAFRYTAAFLCGVGLQTDLCVDRHRGRHLHQIGRKLMLVDCFPHNLRRQDWSKLVEIDEQYLTHLLESSLRAT